MSQETVSSHEGFASIGVVGAGAWGTALANLAARAGAAVMLWAREPAVAESVNIKRMNTLFLDGVSLHTGITATSNMADLAAADAYVFAIPTQYARAAAPALQRAAAPNAPVLLCSKGIEKTTHRFVTEIFADIWPDARLSVLSGPSFAGDVARGMPTAVTLASSDDGLAEQWAASLAAPHFRPYMSSDMRGVELGGAVKNVLAIAAGAVDGRGLGESARAAVIARGFAEFQRLAIALGARPGTIDGLSGLGDLILTATSTQSRNFSLGRALGAGEPLEDILARRRAVSEGVDTAEGVVALGQRAGVELPISEAVSDLVRGDRALDAIIADLLARPVKSESA